MTSDLGVLHSRTPTLLVSDPRGEVIREVAYCRAVPDEVADERITRHVFSAAGHLQSSRDPRLQGANTVTVYSLSGAPLLTDSVDAGWRLVLHGQGAEVLCQWDARGTRRETVFDEQLRPTVMTEQSVAVERLIYGESNSADNQCGQLIRHDHPSGTRLFTHYTVSGLPRNETHVFLPDLQTPHGSVALGQRGHLLHTECFIQRTTFNALDEVIELKDAMGNVRHFNFNVAGELKSVTLVMADLSSHTVVSEIIYSATGQIQQETAGNGIVSQLTYDPCNGRLTQRSSGSLLALHYCYDPAGNILSIQDSTQPAGYFKNQRTEPICRYTYDSLYQLIKATGREVAPAPAGPQLPTLQPLPLDPNQWLNYTRHYEYDTAGNVLTMQHLGGRSFRQRMAVSACSNKSIWVMDESLTGEVALNDCFDANGNLKQLQRGQSMVWNRRNQLLQVNHVERQDAPADSETYAYDGGGQRVCKRRVSTARHLTHTAQTLYLPGLEIHSNSATGEDFHVIRIEGGLHGFSMFLWVGVPPPDAPHGGVRYALTDHLGSCTLELDGSGAVMSQEGYYPFGGTAWWAGRHVVEASYKTLRYCAKERDATGLYYYGIRYYAPWLHRWINPDPGGAVDGLNLYRFVRNNPVCNKDLFGGDTVPAEVNYFWDGSAISSGDLFNVLMFKELNPDWHVTVWSPRPIQIFKTLVAMEEGDKVAERYLSRTHGWDIDIRHTDELFERLQGVYADAFKVSSIFNRERSGPYLNYAAASDVARLASVYMGGLYLDVDVAVGGNLGALEASPQGFMAHVEGVMVSNAVLAGTPLAPKSKEVLDSLVAEYSQDSEINKIGQTHGLAQNVGWIEKRSGAAGKLYGRQKLTISMTGPNFLRPLLGDTDEARKANSVDISKFYSNDRTSSVGPLREQSLNEIFMSGYKPYLNESAAWARHKPGRRASVA